MNGELNRPSNANVFDDAYRFGNLQYHAIVDDNTHKSEQPVLVASRDSIALSTSLDAYNNLNAHEIKILLVLQLIA